MSSAMQSYRFATVTPQGLCWTLKRNCSLTPAQLLAAYGGLCVLSLSVAALFWSIGAVWVLPFTALELLALAAAFLWYARHAADREQIRLGPASLVLEWEDGGRVCRHEGARQGVRVRPVTQRSALVALQVAGQTVYVGRFLRPDLREQLAREIRQALHGA
ncbi:DUF2244 domain-containing protein [Aquabacterium sp. A08]|uniref:DUF2244 domain-containing protein n=1 Tax=Aquabacterium sp. A08 TaxID=2718532 RepID=UPI0035300D7B